jgi:hypothetical protein
MKTTILTLTWGVLAISPLGAQQHSIFFTTFNQNGPEMTRSGSGGTHLAVLESEDVEVLTPHPPPLVPSCEKFASEPNWQTLMGEADADANCLYYQSPLFGQIDALLALTPPGADPKIRDLFLSPSITVGLPCGRTIRPGDVAAIRPLGTILPFLTGVQVATAFGIVNPLNVDAIAKDPSGNIYLSLELDHLILGGAALMEDGAIGMIPAPAILYNSDCTVNSVVAGSGIIAYSEPTIDAMCLASGVRNNVGNPIAFIEDLDGLTIDPALTTQIVPFMGAVYAVQDLFFCGERLTGGAVLTTAGGGNLAVLNGSLLASPAASTGDLVGLQPGPNVGSLNALHVFREPYCRFITDSVNPDLSAGPRTFSLDWGGADSLGFVWLWIRFPPRICCGVVNSVPGLPCCFPEDFLCTPTSLFLGSDINGFGNLSFGPIGGTGTLLLAQLLTFKATCSTFAWSAPITFEL